MQNIQIVLHLNRKATDTTPTAPVVSDLTGKATTTDPVEVTTDPNTKVELLDKDGNVIGSGTTDNTGHVMITPTKPIPEGNVTAKAYDNAEHPNSSTSQPKATDTTPPTAPVVTSDLTGKATTTDPVEVTTDPNTKVELLDKDGNVIGSVQLTILVMSRLHRQNLFQRVMSLRKLMTMRKF